MKTNCNTQNKGMFHLTKTVDYGILLLTEISKSQNEPISLQKIADKTGLSFLFLQKVAGILRKAGIIKATKGKSGGYILDRNISDISLKEIIEIIEGPVAVMSCLLAKSTCPNQKSCNVRPVFTQINDELVKSLESKKLSMFIS